MRRIELRHIARAARNITGRKRMLVVGSQAILASYDEDELPEDATVSREADVAFWEDENNQVSDALDGAIGEMSQFDLTHGYYAQGVSVTTAKLPDGWEGRLVRLPGQSDDETEVWSPEPHDLALSKLLAHRPKDYKYVRALLKSGKLQLQILRERAPLLPVAPTEIRAVERWLQSEERAL
jgi:hypothetical protein